MLVGAVKANDVDGVRHSLTQYPELKGRLNDALPGLAFDSAPIHAAVSRGNREMIEVLLDAGADINVRSRWWAGGFVVLDSADTALVPFLLDRGAVVDVHAAARLGMRDRLEQLISANPSLVNSRGGDGQTPLHFASTIEIAQYLLDRGADIDVRDVDHESTAAQYMIRDRQDVARYLVARGCRTDILMGAALGDLECVRSHLDKDPSSVRTIVSDRYFPKQDPRSGGTIYIWTLGAHKNAHVIAREFGHQPVFDLLMDRSPSGLKLAVACELGDQPTIEALLKSDPNLPQTLGDEDRRKLADSAQDNNTEAVRRMVAAGWPLDPRGQHGATALHWAAFHGNAVMTRDLLQRNAPIDLRDSDYTGTPIFWAIYGSVHGWHCERGDYAGTVEALLDAGSTAPPVAPDLEASPAVLDVLRRRAH